MVWVGNPMTLVLQLPYHQVGYNIPPQGWIQWQMSRLSYPIHPACRGFHSRIVTYDWTNPPDRMCFYLFTWPVRSEVGEILSVRRWLDPCFCFKKLDPRSLGPGKMFRHFDEHFVWVDQPVVVRTGRH